VNKVVPVDQVEDAAMELAKTIASKSRSAVRAGMNIINNSLTCDSIDAALAIERGTLMTLVTAEETRRYLEPVIRMMMEAEEKEKGGKA